MIAPLLWTLSLKRQSGLLALAGLFMLATAAGSAAYAGAVRFVVGALGADPQLALMWGPLSLAGIALFRASAIYGQIMSVNRIGQNVVHDLQREMFAKLIRANSEWRRQHPPATLTSLFVADLSALREGVIRVFSNFTRDIATILVVGAYLFYLDWALALAICLVYPVAFAPVERLGRRLRSAASTVLQQNERLSHHLTRAFEIDPFAKAFGLEPFLEKAAAPVFRDRLTAALRALALRAQVEPILEASGALIFAGVIAFCALRISQGQSSLADLSAFIAGLAILAPAIRALGTLRPVVAEAQAALVRIKAAIDSPGEPADAPNARDCDVSAGEICVENVSVVAENGAYLLQNVSFAARKGALNALIGPSGAGKSTIFALFLRLVEPKTGRILLDQHDIGTLKRRHLREKIAFAPQNPVILDASLRENLCLSAPNAPDEALKSALNEAGLPLSSLAPDAGLDLVLGQNGRQISGGEAQRIGLARAFLRPAPILLLDEPFAGLDPDAERIILTALERRKSTQTILMIEHRPTAIRAADHLVLLEAGEVKASGRFSNLGAERDLLAPWFRTPPDH